MKPTFCPTFFLMVLLVMSCKQILEPPNIKNKTIKLHAPSKAANLASERVTFSWEKHPDINFYRIQIGTPHFEVPHSIVLDSVIEGSVFVDSLSPKTDYAWRIRGENDIYQTDFFSRKFSVKGLKSLALNTPELVAPAQDAALDEKEVYFVWHKMEEAEKYHLQVASPSFANKSAVLFDTITHQNKYLHDSLPFNRNYEWRVSGINYRSESKYVSAGFRVSGGKDISKELPQLIAPNSDVLIQKDITHFTWSALEGASKYHFQLASPDFEKADQVLIDTTVVALRFSDSLSINRFYEWRVRGKNRGYTSKYASKKFRLTGGKDLSKKTVVLMAPYNGATLKQESLRLTWEVLEGADHYHVQLATPSFAAPTQILVDSLTQNTNLQLIVKKGTSYQWRVSAKNPSYATPYSKNVFSIE